MRVRSWPHVSRVAVTLGAFVSILAGLALLSGASTVAAAVGLVAVVLVLRLAFECGAGTVTIRRALDRASTEGTATEPDATSAAQPPRIGIVLD
jgi:uncharacterized membrane protein YphA (DoxX/SURF4 family)